MIQWYFIILSGLITGAVSSLHCVGMCGPLALALPTGNFSNADKTKALLLYNTGRVFTYATLGLIAGLAGSAFVTGGFQQWLSITTGILMLFFVAANTVFKNKSFARIRLFSAFFDMLQRFIASLLKNRKPSTFFLIGSANGLLPCSMVYMAVIAALASGTISTSVVFMLCFGLGTVPFMFALPWFGQSISYPVRNKIKMLFPYVLSVLAVLLILRGMNLNIPFISPAVYHNNTHAVSCY